MEKIQCFKRTAKIARPLCLLILLPAIAMGCNGPEEEITAQGITYGEAESAIHFPQGVGQTDVEGPKQAILGEKSLKTLSSASTDLTDGSDPTEYSLFLSQNYVVTAESLNPIRKNTCARACWLIAKPL